LIRRTNAPPSFSPRNSAIPTGGEVSERDRWQEMERFYARAYDGVHAAGVYVHHAAERLRKIREDAKGRW
jgi:hypothetical protein